MKRRLCTTEVLALRKLDREVDLSWVDWAVSLMEEGEDTPSLRVLAGGSEPFQSFESWALVDRTFVELKLQPFECQLDAAVAYAGVFARHARDGTIDPGAAMAQIAPLCGRLDMPSELHDFWLLYHAHKDLQEMGHQSYFQGADADNIDQVIRDFCRRWLESHVA